MVGAEAERAPRIGRRALLTGIAAACGAAVLAGCTSGPATAPGATTTPGAADPDAALRAEVARQEAALTARYVAAAAGVPQLAGILAIGSRHRAYAAAVRSGPTGTPGSSPTASPAATVHRRPAAEVRASLAAAERTAAATRLRQCGQAVDGELARVLALIGAGAAGAAAALEAGRG